MKFSSLKQKIEPKLFSALQKDIKDLRPCQAKSIKAGLLKDKNILVCTPTASGKTLVGELAALQTILKGEGKAIYIVPLKALANEKFRDFSERYGSMCRIALSIGDMDKGDSYLENYDLIITTSEKLDSLIRHHCPWLSSVKCVVVDEVHLLNDAGRGPTLEILLTILRQQLKKIQIIALSATIGNPQELADWLDAKLIEDNWRPVELKKGVMLGHDIVFH